MRGMGRLALVCFVAASSALPGCGGGSREVEVELEPVTEQQQQRQDRMLSPALPHLQQPPGGAQGRQ